MTSYVTSYGGQMTSFASTMKPQQTLNLFTNIAQKVVDHEFAGCKNNDGNTIQWLSCVWVKLRQLKINVIRTPLPLGDNFGSDLPGGKARDVTESETLK